MTIDNWQQEEPKESSDTQLHEVETDFKVNWKATTAVEGDECHSKVSAFL